ncbi:MAG: metal ABC transporter substrate-binding protein [Planctomycetota bacterium]
MTKTTSVLAIVLAAALAGCRNETPAPEGTGAPAAGGGRTVYVVNHPLEHFARRIGQDAVEVVFPGPGEGDPAFWSPDEETIGAYQRADLVLLNGAGYAKWVERVSLPLARMVDTSAAFRERLLEEEGDVTHAHGPGGEHAHGAVAFTTWLDPRLAVEHARAVHAAFVARWPDDRATFDAELAALEADLVALDERLAAAFAEHAGRPIVASHPVYQYLAARYGLDVASVHWEPDAAPDDAGWRELARILDDHPAALMLWEDDPLPEVAERLAALGLRIVVFRPCGNRPPAGDFLTAMHENAAALE